MGLEKLEAGAANSGLNSDQGVSVELRAFVAGEEQTFGMTYNNSHLAALYPDADTALPL